MQCRKHPADVVEKKIERPVDRRLPGDDDIVTGSEICTLGSGSKRSFEPASDTISRNGVADFLGDGEAKARACVPQRPTTRDGGSFAHLNEKCRR
jgi:hypothetical protein